MRSFLASLLVAGVFVASASHAAVVKEVPVCGNSCNWSISVDGMPMMTGMYVADPVTGQISLDTPVNMDLGDGAFVRLDNMFGNIDPILGFSAAAGTGVLGKTFAFNFSLPIGLSGPLTANSSVSYSLTSLTPAGAQIAPLFGKVVTAQEVDTSVGGLSPLNKGVDVGNTFFFTGGPQTQGSPVYTASSSLTGSLLYDLMSVTVAFSLSPSSQVGLSGFVQQEVVAAPLPAAAWLLAAGLGGLGLTARRQRTQVAA
ncbi:MAG: VPLPA-CTERM sorting domain-containing protein [Burkholderiales bacterium]